MSFFPFLEIINVFSNVTVPIIQFYQWFERFPYSHLCQHLILSKILKFTVIKGIKCNFFICTFLIAIEVEDLSTCLLSIQVSSRVKWLFILLMLFMVFLSYLFTWFFIYLEYKSTTFQINVNIFSYCMACLFTFWNCIFESVYFNGQVYQLFPGWFLIAYLTF